MHQNFVNFLTHILFFFSLCNNSSRPVLYKYNKHANRQKIPKNKCVSVVNTRQQAPNGYSFNIKKFFFKDSSSTPQVIFEHFHSQIFVKKKRQKFFLCSKIPVEKTKARWNDDIRLFFGSEFSTFFKYIQQKVQIHFKNVI